MEQDPSRPDGGAPAGVQTGVANALVQRQLHMAQVQRDIQSLRQGVREQIETARARLANSKERAAQRGNKRAWLAAKSVTRAQRPEGVGSYHISQQQQQQL